MRLVWTPVLFRARKDTCQAQYSCEHCQSPTRVPLSLLAGQYVHLCTWELCFSYPSCNSQSGRQAWNVQKLTTPELSSINDSWVWYKYPSSLSSWARYLWGACFASFPRASLGMKLQSPTRVAGLIVHSLLTRFSSLYYFPWPPTGIPNTSQINYLTQILVSGPFSEISKIETSITHLFSSSNSGAFLLTT